MKKKRDREEQRRKLTLSPGVESAKAALDASPYDPDLWYAYGISLFRAAAYDEADAAFSQGLVYEPFHAYLYFGRGRAKTKANRFWPGVADFEMALRLDPENWNFWYYLATAYNMEGYGEESIAGFENAVRYAAPEECYPMVDWMYQTCVLDLHDMERAKKALSLIADGTTPPPMDYGYCRTVSLYKGLISPENFIDIPDMEEKCIKKPGRIETELNGMYFGLYVYSTVIGDEALGRHAIEELLRVARPATFGCIKGMKVARKMGLAAPEETPAPTA